jgi:hypothetical protein
MTGAPNARAGHADSINANNLRRNFGYLQAAAGDHCQRRANYKQKHPPNADDPAV